VSIDPAMVGSAPDQPGPLVMPQDEFETVKQIAGLAQVEVLSLRAGDRLIVHVEGAAGMSAGGAHEVGQAVRGRLKLDDLPFDVPVLVVSPGIRVSVARPG